MKDYKRGSHTVWDCKYHLVWVTKYRYAVLVGNEPGAIGHRARELLREIARSLELTICNRNTEPMVEATRGRGIRVTWRGTEARWSGGER